MTNTTAWWKDVTLKNQNNEELAAERRKELETSDLIAVFFASYYNLPSRIFTGFLKEFYEEVNKSGLDVIFVPMDETKEDSVDFVTSLHGPWVVLPWSEQGARRMVRNMYNIINIPSVVIVKNSMSAPVVTFDGKNDIQELWTDAVDTWKGKVENPEVEAARQERIKKRRDRISSKLKETTAPKAAGTSSTELLRAFGPAGDGTKPLAVENGQVSEDQAFPQLEESRKELEQLIIDGNTLITNVKIAAEYREKLRQEHVDESRKERLGRLEQEASESKDIYDQINDHWIDTVEHMLPLELHKKLQEHKKECDQLLEKQDEEIYNLKKELEDQEIEFEDNLEMYQKDILLMGDRIDDTVDNLRKTFLEELELIEEYSVKDRERLLEENQRQWRDLLHEFEENQQESLAERKNDALEKFDRLTDSYASVKQETRLLKNRMMNDMRTLFVEREQVKCALQLNMEKLEYNLAVLKKREEENMKMKSSMKRLLLNLHQRLSDKILILKEKICKGKQDSTKLIKEIQRLESLVSDAQCRTWLLYSSNYKKFMDLWSFNEDEFRVKLMKLLAVEKWIFEEQLGVTWKSPDLSVLDRKPDAVIDHQSKYFKELLAITMGSEDFEMPTGSITSAKQLPADGGGGNNGKSQKSSLSSSGIVLDPKHDFDLDPDEEPLIQQKLMRNIGRAVCDHTGFLVEEKLRKVIEPLAHSEKGLVHMDTVFQAIGVQSEEEIKILARYLLKYSSLLRGHLTSLQQQQKSFGGSAASTLMVVSGLSTSARLETDAFVNPSCDQQSNDEISNIIGELEDGSLNSRVESQSALVVTPSVEVIQADARIELQEISNGNEPDSEDVLNVIHEFSSDESLIQALNLVQLRDSGQQEGEEFEDVIIPSDEILSDGSASGLTLDLMPLMSSDYDEDEEVDTTKATFKGWIADVAEGKVPKVPEEASLDDNKADETTFEKVPEIAKSESDCTLPDCEESGEGCDQRISEDDVSKPTDTSQDLLYVEPNDVLKAVAAFCRDYNAKYIDPQTMKSELCQQKIDRLSFPQTNESLKYWDQFGKLSSSHDETVWGTIYESLIEYNMNLRMRNQYVEDVSRLYRQNYEITHLLRGHMRYGRC